MIEIRCNVEDKEAFKAFVYDGLVRMTMKVVYPLSFKTYESYGIDSSDADAQKKFAGQHLGSPDGLIEATEYGVIINDEFHVEGTRCEGSYDIEGFLRNIKQQYPQARFSGAGSIDYHYSMVEYSIVDDGTKLEVRYEDEDEDDYDGEYDGEYDGDYEGPNSDEFFADLPKICCSADTLVYFADHLPDMVEAYENKVCENDPFVVVCTEVPFRLIYSSDSEELRALLKTANCPQHVDITAAFVITSEFGVLGACVIMPDGNVGLICDKPAFQNALLTYYRGVRGINYYLNREALYQKYSALDPEAEALFIEVNEDQLSYRIAPVEGE